MKKFIFGLIAMALAVTAQAQVRGQFQSKTFIAPTYQSILVSNGLYGVTNTAVAVKKYAIEHSFTNLAGALGVTWATNAAYPNLYAVTNQAAVNWFQDITLPEMYTPVIAENAATGSTNVMAGRIVIHGAAGSGINGAVLNAVFVPIYDGVNPSTTDSFTVTGTLTASAVNTVSYNVPLYLVHNAKGLRLTKVYSSDTDASSAFWLYDISYNAIY